MSCGCSGSPCEHSRPSWRALPEFERTPVTMATADRLAALGYFGLARLARRYAVDWPRWWHRFKRPASAAMTARTPSTPTRTKAAP